MRLAALLLLAAVSAPAGSQTVRLTIPLDGSLRAERLGPRELAEVGAVVLTGGFRFTRRSERRAMKARLGDRRSAPRIDASGEVRPDRRAANRAMNALQAYRRAS